MSCVEKLRGNKHSGFGQLQSDAHRHKMLRSPSYSSHHAPRREVISTTSAVRRPPGRRRHPSPPACSRSGSPASTRQPRWPRQSGVVRDSNSGHQMLFPPANWCPIFASRTTAYRLTRTGTSQCSTGRGWGPRLPGRTAFEPVQTHHQQVSRRRRPFAPAPTGAAAGAIRH